MQLKNSLAAGFLSLAIGASATWDAYEEYLSRLPAHTSKHQGKRPHTYFEPQQPFKKFPKSPSRGKNCYVKSHNDMKTDDSEYILDAINKCNDGGHVIFPQGYTYVIGTALDLTHLKHIDLGKEYGRDGHEHIKLTRPQTSKPTSSSQMTRITGKQTPSSRSTRMPQPSSRSVARTSTSTAAGCSTAMVRSGMISTLKTSTSCAQSSLARSAYKVDSSLTSTCDTRLNGTISWPTVPT